MRRRSRSLRTFLKIYVVAALLWAAVSAPLALSFVPVLLLAGYVYQWRWRISPLVGLMTEYFMIFALTLLFSPFAGLAGAAVSLPVLVLLSFALEEYGRTITFDEAAAARAFTNIAVMNITIAVAVMVVALMLGAWALVLADAAVILYFAGTGFYVFRHLPAKAVEETPVQLRILVGNEEEVLIRLTSKTGVGGLLFLKPGYDWVKVSPSVLSLSEGDLTVKVRVAPEWAGPTVAKLQAYVTDRWGLVQTRFEMEPVTLVVIPRARYAAWLAQRYMTGTRAVSLPLMANVASAKPTYGLRRGIEYYGSQLYQPGDSLKNIDWKHTYMHNVLITKEFFEFHEQSAVILINLSAANAEEADRLAYNIIVTAISLSQENIPAALAAYNADDVVLTTSMLHRQEIVLQSMRVVKMIVAYANATKYLNPPDLMRLRSNLGRLRNVESQAARALTDLLQSEYKSLGDEARSHPSNRALSKALGRVKEQCSVVVVSLRNHDAEALAFNSSLLTRQGTAVISV